MVNISEGKDFRFNKSNLYLEMVFIEVVPCHIIRKAFWMVPYHEYIGLYAIVFQEKLASIVGNLLHLTVT